MDKFFNMDGPVMRGLTRVFDLVLLNLLTVLCSIPLITIGASLAAMHSVLLKMVRNEESYIVKSFFRAFKENFKQATGMWALDLFFGGLIALEWTMLKSFGYDQMLFRVIIAGLTLLLLAHMSYSFVLIARFENTFGQIFRNAVALAVGYLPRTLGMVAIHAAWLYVIWRVGFRIGFLVILIGFTLPGFACAYLYTPVLKKLENG
ncbi:MAG: YesL family protein [Eubacterium sp.]|nr:YesL family protein [Eubacterium sp.]